MPGSFGFGDARFGNDRGESERRARDVQRRAGERRERLGERCGVGAGAHTDQAHDTQAALEREAVSPRRGEDKASALEVGRVVEGNGGDTVPA
jgi:hypothetical protein